MRTHGESVCCMSSIQSGGSMKHLVFFLGLLILLVLTDTRAQTPRSLSYQGVLTDTSGNPKPDASYTLTFRLYLSLTGGSPVWTETQSLQTKRGLFAASLGSVTQFPPSLNFSVQYWMSIQVGSEAEMSPRILLHAVGHSLSAAKADTARIAGTVPNGSITRPKIADDQVVTSLNGLRDDITVRGSGGTSITSNGDTITISSTGGGGTGVQGFQNTNNTLDIINPNGPTVTANVKVPLSLSGSVTAPNYLFRATNTGSGHGVQGSSVSGFGVVGSASATSGQTFGVVGNAYSPDGYAVNGYNLATSGNAIGVWGLSASPTGVGVRGEGNIGVVGSSSSSAGYAVSGDNLATTGYAIGVHGKTSSSNGVAIWGDATTGASGTGVAGFSNSWTGVYGQSTTSTGVWGKSNSWVGVYGESQSQSGVWGRSVSGHGVYGEGNYNGVHGITTNSSNYGVAGYNNSGGTGVLGSGTDGVRAVATSGIGVSASTASGLYAVVGYNSTQSSTFGALGYGGFTGVGVYGVQGSGSFAGHFLGLTNVSGNMSVIGDFRCVGDKNFMIDHPLDPENKYLIHSCVESPDRMNIYNGNATTDAQGWARVELPSYFEVLNIDFRYQLTVIGQFAQAIIEHEIENNHFVIRTDKPNVKVSWQVTGIRNDAYAKANPMVVEKEKEATARGKYLTPKLFGQPEELGIHYMKPIHPQDLERERDSASKEGH